MCCQVIWLYQLTYSGAQEVLISAKNIEKRLLSAFGNAKLIQHQEFINWALNGPQMMYW